jgi:hypothetical protein
VTTTTDAAPARPTTDEERRLRNVLAALRDYGFNLEASFLPALPGYGVTDVADHLRLIIGTPISDVALAATSAPSPPATRRRLP